MTKHLWLFTTGHHQDQTAAYEVESWQRMADLLARNVTAADLLPPALPNDPTLGQLADWADRTLRTITPNARLLTISYDRHTPVWVNPDPNLDDLTGCQLPVLSDRYTQAQIESIFAQRDENGVTDGHPFDTDIYAPTIPDGSRYLNVFTDHDQEARQIIDMLDQQGAQATVEWLARYDTAGDLDVPAWHTIGATGFCRVQANGRDYILSTNPASGLASLTRIIPPSNPAHAHPAAPAPQVAAGICAEAATSPAPVYDEAGETLPCPSAAIDALTRSNRQPSTSQPAMGM